ncbi:putative acyl-activating enzyme 2 [Bienertia sinuspersici]
MSAAPTVLNMIDRLSNSHINQDEELGFDVAHLMGLLRLMDQLHTVMKARQGLQHLGLEDVDVRDPVTMESVKQLGEVMFRGNTVMSGYLNDLQARRSVQRRLKSRTVEGYHNFWWRKHKPQLRLKQLLTVTLQFLKLPW